MFKAVSTGGMVVCEKCGYEWVYRGDMPDGAFVTCPACMRKTELERQSVM
jgi:predicted nucleic acid-binding Zn ribbon protein